MPNLPLSVLLFACAVFLVAGFVKGFLGMGLPAIATGLLTMVMAPGQAAALLVVPNAATTGVFVIPLVPYLTALSLERDELVQALGLSLLTSAAALALALARAGALPVSILLTSLYALAPAGLGALFGQWLRQRTRPAVFMRAFAVGLLLIGMHLTIKNMV